MDKRQMLQVIARVLTGEGAKKIAIFGSYARGDEKPGSDIDVLVEFTQRKSLLELIRIERGLSDALGVKVNLLTEKSISPYLIDRVRNEMQVIQE
jgi:predicted nucleotidyltransferase